MVSSWSWTRLAEILSLSCKLHGTARSRPITHPSSSIVGRRAYHTFRKKCQTQCRKVAHGLTELWILVQRALSIRRCEQSDTWYHQPMSYASATATLDLVCTSRRVIRVVLMMVYLGEGIAEGERCRSTPRPRFKPLYDKWQHYQFRLIVPVFERKSARTTQLQILAQVNTSLPLLQPTLKSVFA
jgi:hypothetical protein